MFKIIRKQKLNESTTKIDIQADIVVEKWQPGQYVIVMADRYAKRVAINALDVDRSRGVMMLTFRDDTPSMQKLSQLKIGDELYAFLGPLGQAFPIKKSGNAVFLGEDVQVAAMLPICRELRAVKNKIIGIASFVNRKHVMLETPMRINCNRMVMTNREQSYYKKISWQEALVEALENDHISYIYADGSLLFLEEATRIAKDFDVPIKINLLQALYYDTNIFDHTVINVNGQQKFINTHGLIIEPKTLDFRSLLHRIETYKEFERCRKQVSPRSQPKNAFSIFPKLFAGLNAPKQ